MSVLLPSSEAERRTATDRELSLAESGLRVLEMTRSGLTRVLVTTAGLARSRFA